jgi:hypothetical protein
MNRRQFLERLQQLCLAYGLQGILSEKAFAQSAGPQRLVNFVIKYTGGCTDENGVGAWNYSNVLAPLAPYQNQIVIPLGLNSEFFAPMNSHASPQVCALSGSMTGFVMRETQYPTGNLMNYSTGEGKSIDVLIGESLKAKYNTKIPYLLISNNNSNHLACTHKTSSWGKNGEVLNAITTIEGLTAEITNHRGSCEPFPRDVYVKRLKAMEYIKNNNKAYSDNYIINKEKFSAMENHLSSNIKKYKADMARIDARGGLQVSCDPIPIVSVSENTETNQTSFNLKMNRMYELGIMALQQNITRVLTFNLYMDTTHATSHFLSENPISDYYNASRFMQTSVASFLAKLKAAGLYDDTLIFGNAGSCTLNNVHNYENLSTYVINGGSSGVVGSAAARKPIGSLHLDILSKFGIQFSQYGGTDHKLGVATKGNYF